MYQKVDGIHVWAANGAYDQGALDQMRNVSYVGNVAHAALMADHHLGYSQPIGGVVGYRDAVSPSGVGYDIACGVAAVRTAIKAEDLTQSDLMKIADEIANTISFGVGRVNDTKHDHSLFYDRTWDDVKWITHLKPLAASQLGTVGSGNHYVDLLVDEQGMVWVACHFGSRGFGHKVATGFLSLAKFNGWSDRGVGETMHDNPTIISRKDNEFLFDAYIAAMELAGEYAYAGRNYVIDTVLNILDTIDTYEVHNHHNFAWEEEHHGEKIWVVRKGATPAAPGQEGFIGGSMGDISAVIEGVESEENSRGLYSAVHGAGRVMSRTQAKGKKNKPGLVSEEMLQDATKGVIIRGGGLDEAPQVYRSLQGVLDAHANTISIKHTLKPLVVVMAGADVRDPYKD